MVRCTVAVLTAGLFSINNLTGSRFLGSNHLFRLSASVRGDGAGSPAGAHAWPSRIETAIVVLRFRDSRSRRQADDVVYSMRARPCRCGCGSPVPQTRIRCNAVAGVSLMPWLRASFHMQRAIRAACMKRISHLYISAHALFGHRFTSAYSRTEKIFGVTRSGFSCVSGRRSAGSFVWIKYIIVG